MRRHRHELARATAIAAIWFAPALPATAATTAEVIFFSQWGHGGRLNRMDTTGGPVDVLREGHPRPFGVDYDPGSGWLYMTSPDEDAVYRYSPESARLEPLITAGLFDPKDIALDSRTEQIYFADRRNSAIKRADIDGSNVETILSTTLPNYIELDLVGDKMYLVHGASGPPLLSRANLDGTGLETLVSNSEMLGGLTLDPVERMIYYGVRGYRTGNPRIMKIPMDGGSPQLAVGDLANVPLDLAFDPIARELYWSHFDRIHKVNIDDPETVSRWRPGWKEAVQPTASTGSTWT